MQLASARAVVFDLDGTLYCGAAVVDGAVELLQQLRSQGVQIFAPANQPG